MPRLNLKDDELEGGAESQGSGNEPTLPPNLREIGSGGGKSSPILIVLLVLLIILVAVFALNFFHVINLWGRKPPQVVEMLPEPPTANTDSLAGSASAGEPGTTSSTSPELTPTPNVTPGSTKESATSATTARPSVTAPPLGSGDFSVQVSSWATAAKAKEEADRLSASGFSAYVEESGGGKGRWHRVRVGKFATMKEAQEAASRYSRELETDAVVVKTGQE